MRITWASLLYFNLTVHSSQKIDSFWSIIVNPTIMDFFDRKRIDIVPAISENQIQESLDESYSHCQGWMQMLCCLKVYVEFGKNLREFFFWYIKLAEILVSSVSNSLYPVDGWYCHRLHHQSTYALSHYGGKMMNFAYFVYTHLSACLRRNWLRRRSQVREEYHGQHSR
jgi:hypothetical protein